MCCDMKLLPGVMGRKMSWSAPFWPVSKEDRPPCLASTFDMPACLPAFPASVACLRGPSSRVHSSATHE